MRTFFQLFLVLLPSTVAFLLVTALTSFILGPFSLLAGLIAAVIRSQTRVRPRTTTIDHHAHR
jgi:hypothetical protein